MMVLRQFSKDERGVSAIEFALILPLMVTLLFGMIELSSLLTVDRKMTAVTSTVADLVAQDNIVDTDELDDIFDASASIMPPGYTPGNLSIAVTSIVIDSDGDATVDWSETRNGAELTDGDLGDIPATVLIPDTSLIFTQVSYEYTPPLGLVLNTSFDLNESFYLRPRRSTRVNCTDC